MKIFYTLIIMLCYLTSSAQSKQALWSYNKAAELYKNNKYEFALTLLLDATKESPEFAEAFHLLAFTYDNMGNKEKAIEYYIVALEKESTNRHSSWYNLGILYLDKEDEKNARNCFEQALVQKKDYDKAIKQLALLDASQGEFNDASSKLELLVNKGDVKSSYNLALTYYKQYNYVAAMNEITKVIEHYPGAEAYYLAGNCSKKLSDWSAALNYYNKTIDADNTFVDAFIQAGIIYYNKKQYSEAAQYFGRAYELDNGKDIEIMEYYARALFQAKDFNIAEDVMEKVVKAKPDNPEINYMMAKIYITNSQDAKANRFLQKAVDLGHKGAIALTKRD